MFKNAPVVLETDFYGQKLRLETGLLAKQATSSVIATLGETTVMANVVIGKITDGDYFPLQVIYEEKMYASGKIKGSRFIKREGRPSENAVLTGRMIDRSLRSLFNSHIRNAVQVIITVLSLDEINPPDTLAVLASSSALKIATDQFLGPVASVRIGLQKKHVGELWLSKVDGEIVSSTDFSDLVPFLSKVSESLDIKDQSDKDFIRQIATKLGAKEASWAKEFANLYRSTKTLSSVETGQKYPTEINLIVNPSYQSQQKSLVDLVVSGDGKNIMMVEAGASMVDEKTMGECLDEACEVLEKLVKFQSEFVSVCEEKSVSKKIELNPIIPDEKYTRYWEKFLPEIELALYHEGTKEEKKKVMDDFENKHFANLQALNLLIEKENFAEATFLRDYLVKNSTDSIHPEIAEILGEKGLNELIAQNLIDLVDENLSGLKSIKDSLKLGLEEVIKEMIKENILEKEKRIDGRKLDEVRPLLIQTDVLPRVHGSSLFQRGETQVLNILTLGTLRDAQTLDEMEDFEESTKRYIHHYNFPAYSVGETGRYGSPGRREIGHGALAEKALLPVLPSEDEFPYTMRLVSECLGSNGSTSMASTCASTLSLMAGGVPIKDMVSGIAMGLVLDKNSGNFKVLTDIQGPEDANGDMDFKVTGTANGITAIQLDNKVAGLTSAILKQALIEAKKGRVFILEKMKAVISSPKKEISEYAPGVLTVDIPLYKVSEVIGPSGKMIKSIIKKFDVEIDIEDETGKAYIYGSIKQNTSEAKDYIEALVKEFHPKEAVSGRVFRIEPYGAFVKLLYKGNEIEKEGLIHISNLSNKRVNKVEDVVKIGDLLDCVVLDVNEKGQISLSLKKDESGK